MALKYKHMYRITSLPVAVWLSGCVHKLFDVTSKRSSWSFVLFWCERISLQLWLNTGAVAQGVQQRGEKISNLVEKTEKMKDSAEDFATQMRLLREQQENKKWWQL